MVNLPAPCTRRQCLSALAFVTITAALSTPAKARRRSDDAVRNRIMRLIAREAQNLGIAPALALAVARAESDFDVYARSHKGARGIMQIMPRTARDEYGISAELLWNPRINVRLGLHFLKRLLRRYQGRVDLALSYYNGGSAVGDLPNARVIPATRRYVRKVQRFRRAYSRELTWSGNDSGYRVAGKQSSRRRSKFRTGRVLPDYSGGNSR